jgi:hypothetical protein
MVGGMPEVVKAFVDGGTDAYVRKIQQNRLNGDILLVDNMLMGHGRNSFVGPRKVLVAMAEPYDSFKKGIS